MARFFLESSKSCEGFSIGEFLDRFVKFCFKMGSINLKDLHLALLPFLDKILMEKKNTFSLNI